MDTWMVDGVEVFCALSNATLLLLSPELRTAVGLTVTDSILSRVVHYVKCVLWMVKEF